MSARRGITAAVTVLVVLVLLAVAYFAADVALRSYAESQIEVRLADSLPAGITANPTVTIAGASFITQYLAGSFDAITVDAPAVTVGDVKLAAHAVAHDVPTDQSAPLQRLTGTLALDQDAVDHIVRNGEADGSLQLGPNARLLLGSGTLGYEGRTSFLGIDIGYEVSAKPVAKGTTLDLVPQAVHVTSGPVAFDVKSLLGELANRPISVCVAAYLPPGVLVTSVSVQPDEATLTFEAQNLVLQDLDFEAYGSCNQ